MASSLEISAAAIFIPFCSLFARFRCIQVLDGEKRNVGPDRGEPRQRCASRVSQQAFAFARISQSCFSDFERASRSRLSLAQNPSGQV